MCIIMMYPLISSRLTVISKNFSTIMLELIAETTLMKMIGMCVLGIIPPETCLHDILCCRRAIELMLMFMECLYVFSGLLPWCYLGQRHIITVSKVFVSYQSLHLYATNNYSMYTSPLTHFNR